MQNTQNETDQGDCAVCVQAFKDDVDGGNGEQGFVYVEGGLECPLGFTNPYRNAFVLLVANCCEWKGRAYIVPPIR